MALDYNTTKKILAENDPSSTYNDKFDPRELIANGDVFSSSNPFANEYNEVSTGYNLSNRDYLTGYEDPFTQDIDELRAQRQSWGSKLASGAARVGAKVVQEVANMPGVAYGALAAALIPGSTIEDVVDNAWVQAIDNFSDEFKEEYLPVYAKEAITNGTIWDKATSIDFMANEGADGLGFLASMLAPGAAIKAVSLGSKITSGLGKAARLAKQSKVLGNLGAMANQATKGTQLDDLIQMIGKAKLTPERIDAVSQTVANTMFEAAAEAKGAGQSFEQRMQPLLDQGVISPAEFNKQKHEAMRNTLVANMFILAAPNAAMTKLVYGNRISKGVQSTISDAAYAGKKATQEASKATTRLGRIGGGIKGIAGALKAPVGGLIKTGVREGFFEEGMQSTMETYLVDSAVRGEDLSLTDTVDILGDIPEAYTRMIGTPEGQESVLLGFLMGGGMQAISETRGAKRQKRRDTAMLADIEELDARYKIFNTDIYDVETGKIDPVKLLNKLEGVAGMEAVARKYDEAVLEGDTDTIDALQAWAVGEMAKDFIMKGEEGMIALEEYLKASEPVAEAAGLQGRTREEFISSTMARAKKVQKDYELFQDLGKEVIKLDNEDATQSDKELFLSSLGSVYMSKRNSLYHYQDALAAAKQTRSDALKSAGVKPESVLEDTVAMAAEADNNMLKTARERVQALEKKVDEVKQDLDNFWNGETIKKDFDEFAKNAKQLREQFAEANQKAVQDLSELIKDATTPEDLDAVQEGVDKLPKESKEGLNAKIKAKRKELKNKKASTIVKKSTEQAQETQEQEETNEVEEGELEDVFNYIEQFANGEPFTLTPEQSRKYGREGLMIKVKVGKNEVTVGVIQTGEEITIPKGEKPTTSPKDYNPLKNYSTEGSDQHNLLVPTENENEQKPDKEDKEVPNGVKLISTDKKTGNPIKWVAEQFKKWIAYEREPINKVGKTVGFAINQSPGDGLKVNEALKAFNSGNFSDMNLLIDYLPLNAVFPGDVQAPMLTRPAVTGQSQDAFNGRSRKLRKEIVEALAAGQDINTLSTVVEYQHQGKLIVDEYNADGSVARNNIMQLHFLKGLKRDDAIKEIHKRIGVVNKNGDIILQDGSKRILNKPLAAGEIFLMIPKANGEDFALKLNISYLKEGYAEVLADLYEARFNDPSITKDTIISDLNNEELNAKLQTISKELKLINKGKDVTVGDVINFFVWEDFKNRSSRKIGFGGTGVTGESQLKFGNPKRNSGGAFIRGKDEFDKEQLINFFMGQKPQNIAVRPHKNNPNGPTMFKNLEYLGYLLDNNILSTNAVVGANNPTFQGYTNIYLKNELSNKAAAPVPTSTPKEQKDHDKLEEKILAETKKRLAEIEYSSTADLIEKTAQVQAEVRAEFEKSPTPIKPKTASSIADIEKRRKAALASVKKEANGNITWVEDGVTKNSGMTSATEEEVINGLNAKYDAEIEANEGTSSKKLEKTGKKIRNSQKNTVSLQEYKGIPVIESDNIVTAEGTKGAAKYSKDGITVNRTLLKEKFKQKAWTKPRVLKEIVDGIEIESQAAALPEDTFKTYAEWEAFVIEHEYQHSLLSRADYGKEFPWNVDDKGAYETEINKRALAEIKNELEPSDLSLMDLLDQTDDTRSTPKEIEMKVKIKTLRTYVNKNKLVKGGAPMKSLFMGTEQEILDKLTKIVEAHGQTVDNILTDCN